MKLEQRIDESLIERGSAGSYVLVCPRCDRTHFRIDTWNLDNEYCVWCGDVKLQPLMKETADA